MFRVVCVLVLQGLLVWALPTNTYDGSLDTGSVQPAMVEGVAEFSGIVPASGSVTILGNFGCGNKFPPNPPVVGNAASFIPRNKYLGPANEGYPSLPRGLSYVDDMYSAGPLSLPSNLPIVDHYGIESPIGSDAYSLLPGVNDEFYDIDPTVLIRDPSTEAFECDEENTNEMDDLRKKTIVGSLIADSIIAEKEAEIDAKLAEIDLIVNSELYKMNSIIDTILEDAVIQEINVLLNSDLSEIESAIDTLEIMVESELQKVEKIVESMLENQTTIVELEQVVTELLADLGIVQLTTETTQEDMDEALTEMDKIVESELAVIDSFIESELALVDLYMESELAKMESFVDTKQTIIQALIDAEVNRMNMHMESELDKIGAFVDFGSCFDSEPVILEAPIQGATQFSGRVPAAGHVSLFGNTGCNCYSPMFEKYQAMPEPQFAFGNERFAAPDYCCEDIRDALVMGETSFSGIVPAVGRVKVIGGCGCPPLFPSNPPAVGTPEPFIIPSEATLADRITSALLAREKYCAQNRYPSGGFPQINHLPTVNLNNKHRMGAAHEYSDGMAEEALQFSGQTTATGRTTVFANFGCAPLLPTEEGPDGKKYIWLLNRPNNNVIPPATRRQRPFPPMPSYPTDFPENIMMDASRNYERFVDDAVFGQEYQDAPVSGDMFFEGRVPAFGSVSLTGRCA